jgi:hypothetical protein
MKTLFLFMLLLAISLGSCSSEESTTNNNDIDAGVDADTNNLNDSNGDSDTDPDGDIAPSFVDIPLLSSVTKVQPMTGIVLWNDHEGNDNSAIQLEYSYMGFSDIVIDENPSNWDWSGVETLLNTVASHGHQAILRFYYVYPGSPTTVPGYIKNLPSYNESTADSEGESTDFPDWSNDSLKTFTKDFYTQFAAIYDNDPRIAFLQVGFGLWGEYHIYDPGANIGVNFPDFNFQEDFFHHIKSVFTTLHWSISIDASDDSNTPFASVPSLKTIGFGLFDDSFLNEDHGDYNNDCFLFFGDEKRMESPVGGEFSYYTNYDQQHVLDLPDGPHGRSYESLASQYNVSYMIGNDQPQYQSWDRIKEAGIASGYNFKIISFKAATDNSIVTVENTGIAPIYYHAYVTINGVRSSQSLLGLIPGDQREFSINSGGETPLLTIECDRLVPGQTIQFDASL